MQPPRSRMTLGLVVVLACLSIGETSPTTGVEGIIMIGPTDAGPTKAGAPLSAPFANATFVVEGKDGASQSFTTDTEGHFRIFLSPGHYVVSRQGPKPA